ncbi:MAG: response regulator transcription factor [Lachnospiraceae bacterium]|nr:response regulator transcription factor [Lachnospiraceae bacterium]
MKILLAEDEQDLREVVTAYLELQGNHVVAVEDGAAAVEKAAGDAYDAVVMDIMMPVMDGVSAMRRIRETGNPVPAIFLTAKTEVSDRVEGLDAGADDYLTKPFALKELLARVRSMTRRKGEYMPKSITLGRVTLKIEEGELSAENAVRLAGKELKLMEFFMRNPGKEFTTEELFSHIWANEPDQEIGIVWMYISFLRTKLRSVYADLEITGSEGESFCLKISEEAV